LKLLLFIISYILLSTIGSLSYVGLLFLFFWTLKKIFNMNEDKWTTLFKYRKGKGLYYVMVFPYLVMLVVMFPLSLTWFELINFEYRVLGSLSVIILLTLTLVFKFPKLKESLNEKYQGTH